jgi:hypothetical protein
VHYRIPNDSLSIRCSGILTVVAVCGTFAPGKEYNGAQFQVSSANPIVKIDV